MKDPNTGLRRWLNRIAWCAYFTALIVGVTGCYIHHYVSDTTGAVRPFGTLLFYGSLIFWSIGWTIRSRLSICGAEFRGIGRTTRRAREERLGWLFMVVAGVASLVGTSYVARNLDKTLFVNVPQDQILVKIAPNDGSIQLYFAPSLVCRSPWERAFFVPRKEWSVEFNPELLGQQGEHIRVQLSFCCSVNCDSSDKFALTFRESLKRIGDGNPVGESLLLPVTELYQSALKNKLVGREVHSLDELQKVMETGLKDVFKDAGVTISKVRVLPIFPMPAQPLPPIQGRLI